MKDIINIGKNVIKTELNGINKLYKSINIDFAKSVKKLSKIKGKVIITGVGKSLIIAKKISSTMNSTGTLSQCIDPTSMAHGDLGIVKKNDAIIVISNSGNSLELDNLVNFAKKNAIFTIAISSNQKSKLVNASNLKIILPKSKEACAIGLAPTTSTSMALIIGDALCVSLMKIKKFKISDYKKIHPAGSLGTSMIQVKDIMYTGFKLPLVRENSSIKDVILEMSKKSFGHVGVKNSSGSLIGIISDGDLRRSFKKKFIDNSANEIMTRNPKMIHQNEYIIDAIKFMNKKKITCLFVSDPKKKSKASGIIHLHQILQYVQ